MTPRYSSIIPAQTKVNLFTPVYHGLVQEHRQHRQATWPARRLISMATDACLFATGTPVGCPPARTEYPLRQT